MKRTLLITLLALLWLPQLSQADDMTPRVRIETTLGNITLELDRKAAPKTVANFLSYAESGAYTGTIFHRVMKGFMIQTGGLTENMEKKPTRDPIVNEADNGLKNRPGTVAMARTNSPHSATSQFFINTVNNTFLNHTGKS
ncbi:MAG: peptidylprolyl isomerase, partial [Desulfobacterales bacterium]